ncbi:hypothetical protein [Herbaspirillum sp. ST 5-3]
MSFIGLDGFLVAMATPEIKKAARKRRKVTFSDHGGRLNLFPAPEERVQLLLRPYWFNRFLFQHVPRKSAQCFDDRVAIRARSDQAIGQGFDTF